MNPTVLAEERHAMSVEYARLCEKLARITPLKASEWLRLREESKSDQSATKKWEMSESGIEETQIKLQMKGLEKLISSKRGLLEAMNNDYRQTH